MKSQQNQTKKRRRSLRKAISRRDFLCGVGAAAVGLVVGGCSPHEIAETPDLGPTTEPPPTGTPVPSRQPTLSPTDTPEPSATVEPSPTSTSAPTQAPVPTATVDARTKVAVAQAASYDAALVRQQVEAMLDSIGGLGNVVGLGDRVAIKVNLTGGIATEAQAGAPAVDSYVTHPQVVHALCQLLRDAGARQLFIVEAVYEWDSYRLWGYEDVAAAVGATLIDLNNPYPYADFNSVPVGDGWSVYDSFIFHRILGEIDTFVSVAKMKCHWCCGVTHTMKNLVGLVPAKQYTLEEDHLYRSALHGPGDVFKTRLPGVITDLNLARPIDLALVDGIKTAEGGEGPWQPGFAPVQPGVLVAGKDPVAVDSVATAVMGFDPAAIYPAAPFLRADNHLSLARGLGLGTHYLDEIALTGASIDDVRYPFAPCWE
ncbi:MAG: DUF362 domain-containing protein [Chloroflexi bacterium]|nr:DUF362 domain-containing protein [Chloroflexota bacterium]